jgi:integrase
MLNLISRVLADLVRQGALSRDVAALVKRLKRPETKLTTFTEKEVRQLLKHVENDRLGHAWHLALAGLRRGEISGLRWSDIQLDDNRDAGTLTIAHNRVSVGGRVHDTDPKTERSARTLPLTPALAKALKRAKAGQAAERLRLGPHYIGVGEHVVVDDAGRPYHPDTLSDFWRELCGAAKVRQIRLHDARHSCASIMHAQGCAYRGHLRVAWARRPGVHHEDLCARPGRGIEGSRGYLAEGCDTLVTASHLRTSLRRVAKRVYAGRDCCDGEPPVRIELTTARLQGE